MKTQDRIRKALPRQILRQQRRCAICGQWCRVSVTTTGDGWERHVCEYGHVVEYRIMGGPN